MQNSSAVQLHSATILPTFPTGKRANHAAAILAMLIRGDRVTQYDYARATSYPATDARSRISELKCNNNWWITSQFCQSQDLTGIYRRCKEYWLPKEWLAELYDADPAFKKRCQMLTASFNRQFGGDK